MFFKYFFYIRETMKNLIGLKIKEIKRLYSLTNEEFGAKRGVTGQAVNNVISGKNYPIRDFINLLIHMGINLNALLDDSVSVAVFLEQMDYKKLTDLIDRLKQDNVEKQMTISALSRVTKKKRFDWISAAFSA